MERSSWRSPWKLEHRGGKLGQKVARQIQHLEPSERGQLGPHSMQTIA